MSGVIKIPIKTTQVVKKEIKVSVAFKNSFVAPRLSQSPSRYPLKVGINATEIEFSAKWRRRRFGIINAIPKASAYFEVPKKAALVISLTRPNIREHSVKKESESPALKSDFFDILK